MDEKGVFGMNTTTKIIAVLGLAFGLSEAAPIDDIGALSVKGTQVVGANGQPAQLRGMSFFWNIAPEARDYWNANVVSWLAEDWHANIVRAAMAVEDNWGSGQEGYAYNQSRNQSMVETVVDAAIAKGIYVIIDWHSHWTNDRSVKENGKDRWELAKDFFTAMATKYGQYPNVIYEIYNEPGTDEWAQIKPYAEYIIPIIRAIDPDNLIVVGTPGYSSKVDKITSSLLSDSYSHNVAYTFHFYASDDNHYNNYLPMVKDAASKLPLFITECGLTPASGNGAINYERVNAFWNWIDQEKLSWAAWSIVNKDETSAALQKSAGTSGNWSESDLRESGKWFRNKLREQNPEWTPISGESPKPSSSASQQGGSSNSQVASSGSTQPASSGSQGTEPQSAESNQPASSGNQPVNPDSPNQPGSPDQEVAAIGSLSLNSLKLSIHGRILQLTGVKSADISIFDMQGRPILVQQNVSDRMYLKDIATGVFIVRVKANGTSLMQKISVR
jgi:endoglucanase